MNARVLRTAALLILPATTMVASADLASGLAAESRPAEDRARDAGRKPAEVLAWLGIGPGMTVMDLAASGGCYKEVLAPVKTLLKPGGVLGIIDHYGDADKDNNALHRLDVDRALPIIQAAGFELTSSDLLRNADDDRTTMVFDEAIRGKTDRVLYKLVKPAE